MPGVKKDSDEYIQKKKIPELFQSLTVALMYNKPQDHVDYLIKCLDEVKQKGENQVFWNTFLPQEQHSQVNQANNTHGSFNPGRRQ